MAHRHHRRHHRRNPEAGNLIWGVAGAAGGFLITGPAASMVAPGGGILNYGLQAAVALGGGWAVGKFKRPLGWGFAVGGLASLALQMYRDFTGAGMSYYAVDSYPVPGYSTANPLTMPQYGVASSTIVPASASGAPAALPAPATSATRTARTAPRFARAA